MTTDAHTVLTRLTRNLAAGDILLLHDGHAARSRDGQPIIVSVLPLLLERIRELGLSAVTLRHATQYAPDKADIPVMSTQRAD